MRTQTCFVVTASVMITQGTWAQTARVDYGTVNEVRQVDLMSSGSTPATVGGALAGGTMGYLFGRGSSTGKKRRSMIGGAALGGIVGNVATRGTNQGYAYTVKLMAGSSVNTTTEQGRIDTGNGETVERGDLANSRRVSEAHCQRRDTAPSAEHLKEAGECDTAKAAILNAETTEALETAVRKARLLCEE